MVSNAVHVMRVLTVEADDDAPDDSKDKATQAMGRKGGAAREAGTPVPEPKHATLRLTA